MKYVSINKLPCECGYTRFKTVRKATFDYNTVYSCRRCGKQRIVNKVDCEEGIACAA